MAQEKGISLFDLQAKIKERVQSLFMTNIWIKGEISAIKENYSGHCYLDLIDKSGEEEITAKANAIIWNSSWRVLRPYFESTTGAKLEAGMTVMLKVQVQYSELYGLSLVVYDIDPDFSIGELEKKRLLTIERLKKEGMFDMNSTLELGLLPRRFAVISSDTAAGYRDFEVHLHDNQFGFAFHTRLFSAPVQGATAPDGIIAALDAVIECEKRGEDHFDAVLLLRGGGSPTDLLCFDDYDLAANIAQFPLPVLVAVGHDQDYHICDMVSCVSVKTPTALADYLIGIFLERDTEITMMASKLALAIKNKCREAKSVLDSFDSRVEHSFRIRLKNEENKLAILEQRVLRGDPNAILEKGYSILKKDGKRVFSISTLGVGDKMQLMMKEGTLDCKIDKITINK